MASNDFSLGKLFAYIALLALGALGLFMTLCGLVFVIPGIATGALVIVPVLSIALGVGALVLTVKGFGGLGSHRPKSDDRSPPSSPT